MAEMDVGNEVLCPAGEELVGGSKMPRDVTDVGVLSAVQLGRANVGPSRNSSHIFRVGH